MFEIKVDSFHKAHALMDQEWPTKVISLIAPDEKRCELRGKHHLRLRFDDIEYEGHPEWKAPSLLQIKRALTHTKNLTDDDRLLVHCTAGKSRSTAIAIGVLIQHGMTPQEAFSYVLEMRPAMIPNRLIIGYIDSELNLEGSLLKVVDDYFAQLRQDGNIPLRLLGRHQIDD